MRKRPMCAVGLCLALAVRFAFCLPPDRLLPLSAAAGLTGLLFLALRRQKLLPAALVCFSAALGIICCGTYQNRYVLPFVRADGKVIALEGIVEDAVYSAGSARYTVLADYPGEPDLPNRQRLYLRVYGDSALSPGDMIRCEIKLYTTGWDSSYRLWAAVRGTGYLTGEWERTELERFRADRLLLRQRRLLLENLFEALPEDSAGLAAAMALGRREELDDQMYLHLKRAGSVHLVTVSGLHLSIFAGVVLLVLRKTGLPQVLRVMVTLLACLGFVGLVGFSASLVRAFTMLVLLHLANLLGRDSDSINSLGLALLAVCILFPHWTLGDGIWLSFGSTWGILAMGGPIGQWLCGRYRPLHPLFDRPARGILQCAGIGAGAFLATLPLVVLFYGRISLLAPLTNVALAPFVAPALAGSLLCALFGGGLPLAKVTAGATHICLRMLAEISRVLGSLPFSTVTLDRFWFAVWLVLALVSLGAVFFLGKKGRRMGMACCAAACAALLGGGQLADRLFAPDRVELAVLGEGGAAVVLYRGEAVLLGVPGRYEAKTLVDYLHYRNIRRISAWMALDAEEQIHSGVLLLDREVRIGCVIGPDDPYITEQLAGALPGIPVYSGAGAIITAPGGVRLRGGGGGDIRLQIGKTPVLKSSGECAIIKGHVSNPEGWIHICEAGIFLPEGVSPAFEPLGAKLFEEVRIYLPAE